MARVLLGYAIHFERRSPLSLAICANVLRILDSRACGSATYRPAAGCRRNRSRWPWAS